MGARAGGPNPIQGAIHAFLREAGLRASPAGAKVRKAYQAWARAVGPALARRAVPVRLAGGELTVEVESAAHMHELKNFSGEGYRLKANELLRDDVIRRVVFKLRG